MKLPLLATTDLHFQDGPDVEYRWALFPWLHKQVEERGLQSIAILGDLTDAKDNHSAALVNRLTTNLKRLAEHCPVTVLAGNHDWLKRDEAFFRFLNHIPGLRFYADRTEDTLEDLNAMFLPYSKNPAVEWAHLDLSHYDTVFMHQTVRGSLASNGQAMDGEELPSLEGLKVYSGDIHVPQVVGNVTYIGSPYHVHFGDAFEPRVLLLDRKRREHWLHFPSPRRVMAKVSGLRDLKKLELDAGDMVKLSITLPAEERHEWGTVRSQCLDYLRRKEVKVFGAALKVANSAERLREARSTAQARKTPQSAILAYVERFDLGGDAYDAAMDVLES